MANQRKSLSGNVLDMKFMRKSKEDREKKEEQEKYAQVFESEQVKEEKGKGVRVTYQPNQAVLENLQFPRRSYGGQNPEIEKLMKEHDGAGGDDGVDSRPEADLSDAQMAAHYRSVVGTVGKKFQAKRQRSAWEENEAPRAPAESPALKRTREFLKPEL